MENNYEFETNAEFKARMVASRAKYERKAREWKEKQEEDK